MKKFFVYEIASGKVLKNLTLPDHYEVSNYVQEGQVWVLGEANVGDIYNPDTSTFEKPILEIPLATWGKIKKQRNQLEQAPIAIYAGTFDVDDLSMKRMGMAIENFEVLPTLIDNKLTWKLADNSTIDVTKEELQNIYDLLNVQLAVRAAHLHKKAAQLFSEQRTLSDVLDVTVWEI